MYMCIYGLSIYRVYIYIYVAHTFRVYLASFLCIQYKMPS